MFRQNKQPTTQQNTPQRRESNKRGHPKQSFCCTRREIEHTPGATQQPECSLLFIDESQNTMRQVTARLHQKKAQGCVSCGNSSLALWVNMECTSMYVHSSQCSKRIILQVTYEVSHDRKVSFLFNELHHTFVRWMFSSCEGGKKTEAQDLKARAYTPTQLLYKSCI